MKGIRNVNKYCKHCQKITEHMDLGNIKLRFKCNECGEYNE